MTKHLKIIIEIATTTTSKITYAVNIILFSLSLFFNSPELPRFYYALILLIGFIISTIEIIEKRDDLIKKIKNIDMPAITLYFKKVNNKTVLKIMNLWNKPIKDIQTNHIKLSKLFTFGFILSGTNILRPDERRELILTDGNNKPHVNPGFLASFKPEYLTVKTEMAFSFKDFNNKKYKAIMKFEKEGIRCKSISALP